jgi:hypothetical protein
MNRLMGALLLLEGLHAGAASAVSVGTIDTFQDGSTAGWSTGSFSPNQPANVGSGGPAGAGDKYLLLTSTGGLGAGSKLVAFSGPQWGGNYLGAGVTSIQMMVNNLGSTDLSLRLYFESANSSPVSSTDAVSVHAGSGWTSVTFSALPGALSAGAANVLGSVTQFRLYHSVLAGTPSGGASIVAQLGIDNVTAVPEPSEWIAMLAGLLVVAGACRKARGRLSVA